MVDLSNVQPLPAGADAFTGQLLTDLPNFDQSPIARRSASLTHAAMHAYAVSLLSMPPSSAITGEEDLPPLGQLVAQHPEASTTPSRLPGP